MWWKEKREENLAQNNGGSNGGVIETKVASLRDNVLDGASDRRFESENAFSWLIHKQQFTFNVITHSARPNCCSFTCKK